MRRSSRGPVDPETVTQDLLAAYERGKAQAIVVVAEGACYNAEGLTRYFQAFVARVAATHPDELTVDGAYSVRRRAKAPISTPLEWSEVKPTLIPSDFNMGTFAKRLKHTDPWSDFFERRQSLGDASQLLSKL